MEDELNKYIDIIKDDKTGLSEKTNAYEESMKLLKTINDGIIDLKKIPNRKKDKVSHENFTETLNDATKLSQLFQDDKLTVDKLKKLKELKIKLVNLNKFIKEKKTTDIFVIKQNDFIKKGELKDGILIETDEIDNDKASDDKSDEEDDDNTDDKIKDTA